MPRCLLVLLTGFVHSRWNKYSNILALYLQWTSRNNSNSSCENPAVHLQHHELSIQLLCCIDHLQEESCMFSSLIQQRKVCFYPITFTWVSKRLQSSKTCLKHVFDLVSHLRYEVKLELRMSAVSLLSVG